MEAWSLNTWSLEGQLGPLRTAEWSPARKDILVRVQTQPEIIPLLELPARLAAEGWRGMELSYAQVPHLSAAFLESLRRSCLREGISLVSLLLDYGDLTTADAHRADKELAWYKAWIDAAARIGAQRVRIPAGDAKQPDSDTFQAAVERLLALSEYAAEREVRVVTENIGGLLSTAERCLRLLEACGGRIGFTADFGNFKQDHEHQLRQVLPHAETVHAKARLLPDGSIDEDDFLRCLQLCRTSGFDGVYSYTYLGKDDPWPALARLRELRPSDKPALQPEPASE